MDDFCAAQKIQGSVLCGRRERHGDTNRYTQPQSRTHGCTQMEDKDTGTDQDSLQPGTDSDSSNRETEDGRHGEHEVEVSNLNLLLVT